MKRLGTCCASLLLLLGLLAVSSTADEPHGAVSPSLLGNMGLGSMQVMADDEGLAVRGRGGTYGGLDSGYFWRPMDVGKKKSHGGKMVAHQRVEPHKRLAHHGKSFGPKDFGHRDFGPKNFGPRSFGPRMDYGHKLGGGMIWQPKAVVWGGGIGLR